MIRTPQRVLAIIGGAFVIATAHALLIAPLSVETATITSGTDNVQGDPSRVRTEESATNDGVDDQSTPATESDAGESESESQALIDPLDAPVPEGMLTLRESSELWDLGAYFLDARYLEEFEAGRIQYASWLPSTRFDSDLERVLTMINSIPIDGTIVIYCVGGDCDASKNTANRLEQLGYMDLRIMGAGYNDWVDAGLAIESGPLNEGSP